MAPWSLGGRVDLRERGISLDRRQLGWLGWVTCLAVTFESVARGVSRDGTVAVGNGQLR